MPTYEYECRECHQRLEAVQKFSDPALTVCPNCGGELRKVFSSVGIVFKGSGFYKTDSRGSESAAPASPSSSTSTDASSAAAPAASTPAASPSAPATPASSTTD